MRRRLCCLAAFVLLTASPPSFPACGASFCSISTDRAIRGNLSQPGAHMDLRYEFIDQDQLRAGSNNIGPDEVTAHHTEIRTVNRNWIVGADYVFDQNWGIRMELPIVSRSHSHIHHHHGEDLLEQWNFSDPGDFRVIGRYRLTPDTPSSNAIGFQFGVKLPTGDHDVTNEQGETAERSLQPGSGTTDAIVGAFYSGFLRTTGTWFAEAVWVSPLAERDNYAPGDRITVNAGFGWPTGEQVAMLLQVNTRWQDRDSGSDAEPDDTGGTFVYLSPGVSMKAGNKTQLYGFIQLPVYQYVNGVQLVADWALVAGASYSF